MKTKKQMLFFFFLLSLITVRAQENGKISGIIMDENGKLPGAAIYITDLDIYSDTDLNGEFSITQIPPGEHNLLISYFGHEDVEQPFTISEGQSLDLGTIKFEKGDNIALESIVITGSIAPSQAKAYSIQRNAAGIMNVIASDVIGKLPDRNAAEAVQRMPGVAIERDHGEGRYVTVRGTPLQWNSTLINGNRMPTSEGTSDNSSGTRTSPLDIFPSEMIEYVQLSKAITPDMEGDAIGGSINFITRTAPKKRIFKIVTAGGYNGQSEKGTYDASLLFGDTFFDGKLGIIVSGSYWKRNWGTDNYELVYDAENQAIHELQLRDYLGVRRTYGLNAGLEYNFNKDHKIFLRGVYTDFQDDETAFEHVFSFADNEFSLRRRRGITGINLYGGELGGIHETTNGKWKFDWKASTYTTDMETRKPNKKRSSGGWYEMAYFSTPATYGNLAPDGNKYLDIDSPSGYSGDHFENVQPYLTTPIDANNLQLKQLIGITTESYERDWVGEMNLELKVSENVSIKVGGKYKSKSLERGSPMHIYAYLGNYQGISNPMGQYQLQDFPYNGGFLSEINNPYDDVLLPGITLDQLHALFSEENLNNPLFHHINMDENNPSSAASFYTGEENVTASYAMGDIKITDKFRIIGGLRYEHTALEYNGNEVVTIDDETTEINKKISTSDFDAFLPMIHLKYSPEKNLNFRLAYTRTFARANFSDLNPTESTNLLFTPYTISRGNIDLKPTFSNNFDLLGEYFFRDIGILNAGVFYKSLENVIYNAQSYQTIGGTLYRITQPENSDKGWLMGTEVGFSRRFTFLSGFWSGFGVEANYTYTKSEMDVPNYSENDNGDITVSTTKESLPNQSEHIFNASLFYEKGKIMVRLAGNFKGEALAVVQGNPENYRWYDKNLTLDLSASYKISDKVMIFLEMNNLTNEPLRYYQGNTSRPEQTEYYSIRGLLGINFNIF